MKQTKIIVKPDSKGEKFVKDLYANMQDFKKKIEEGELVKPENEKQPV